MTEEKPKKKVGFTNIVVLMMLFVFLVGYSYIAKTDLEQCVRVNTELSQNIEMLIDTQDLTRFEDNNDDVTAYPFESTVTPTTNQPLR